MRRILSTFLFSWLLSQNLYAENIYFLDLVAQNTSSEDAATTNSDDKKSVDKAGDNKDSSDVKSGEKTEKPDDKPSENSEDLTIKIDNLESEKNNSKKKEPGDYDWPYMFPMMGNVATSKGFALQLPFGVSAQYFYMAQNLEIPKLLAQYSDPRIQVVVAPGKYYLKRRMQCFHCQ